MTIISIGSFERIDMLPNEEIILDNGVFLAAPSHMNYTLVRLGKSLISSFLGFFDGSGTRNMIDEGFYCRYMWSFGRCNRNGS